MFFKTLLTRSKISIFVFLSLFLILGNYKITFADQWGYGKDGSDCIFWSANLNDAKYVPGETINLSLNSWNNGCNYDWAWVNVSQWIERFGIDTQGSAGPISGAGSYSLAIPSNISTGTHSVALNTHAHIEAYDYTDVWAPRVCAPGWWCGCSCDWGGCRCNWCEGACTGGQRVSHSPRLQYFYGAPDIARNVYFTVVKPEATLTASLGSDISDKLPPRSTTTISWTSKNLDSMDITLNDQPWKASYTVMTPTFFPEVGYYRNYQDDFWSSFGDCPPNDPAHPEAFCFSYSPFFGLGKARIGRYWFQQSPAQWRDVPVFNPFTNGSTSTSPLVGGKNTFVFRGYINGRSTPAITKSVDVYVDTNIVIDMSATPINEITGLPTVTYGFPAKLTWKTKNADECSVRKDYENPAWKPLSANATSGTNVLTPYLFATTTFTLDCMNRDLQGNDFATANAYIKIGVKTAKYPKVNFDVLGEEILWDVEGDVYSCSLVQDGVAEPISNELSGGITIDGLAEGTSFTLSCPGPFPFTQTKKSIAAVPNSNCKITQQGGGNELYINRKTTFIMENSNGTVSNVKWTVKKGTVTEKLPNNQNTKIFTTTGSRIISAVGKITAPDGTSSLSSCSTSTVFKQAPETQGAQ